MPNQQCPAVAGHPLQRWSWVTAWPPPPATPARLRCRWPGHEESRRAPRSLGQRGPVRRGQRQGRCCPHHEAGVGEPRPRTRFPQDTLAHHRPTEALGARLLAAEGSQQRSHTPLPFPFQKPESLACPMGKRGQTKALARRSPWGWGSACLRPTCPHPSSVPGCPCWTLTCVSPEVQGPLALLQPQQLCWMQGRSLQSGLHTAACLGTQVVVTIPNSQLALPFDGVGVGVGVRGRAPSAGWPHRCPRSCFQEGCSPWNPRGGADGSRVQSVL